MGFPREWSQHQTDIDQEEFGQCSQAGGGILVDGPAQGQEMDLMILVSPFQVRVFYHLK